MLSLGLRLMHATPMGARVLLIDDDAMLRNLCARILTEAGYQVTTLDTLEAGIAEIQRDPLSPCVAIVDRKLPGVPGDQLQRELLARGIHRYPPLVLISGSLMEVPAGFAGVLLKPFGKEALLSLVSRFSE